MAAPTFVAAGTASGGNGNLTPGLPAGWAQNDIFIMVLNTDSGDTVTAPSGWAHTASSPATQSLGKVHYLWKRAGSSESGPTVTDPSSGSWPAMAIICAFRGCVTSGNPWDVVAADTSDPTGTAITAAGPTTTVADTLCFVSVITQSGSQILASGWANSNLTSVTERVDSSVGSSNVNNIHSATGAKATASAVGNTTATLSSSVSIKPSLTIALKPAAGGTEASAGTAADTVTSNAPRGGVGAKAQVIG